MKKDLQFIFASACVFYFFMGLILPSAGGFLALASLVARGLDFVFAELKFALIFLQFVLFNFYFLPKKAAAKFSLNSLFILLFFIFLAAAVGNYAALSRLGSINFLLSFICILCLIYLNFNLFYSLFKSKKSADFIEIDHTSKNDYVEFHTTHKNEEILHSLAREISNETQNSSSKNEQENTEQISRENSEKISRENSEENSQENSRENSEKISQEKSPKNEEKPQENPPKPHKKVQILSELQENKELLNQLELGASEKPKDFILPSIKLLEPVKSQEIIIDEDELDEKIALLLAKLKEFKISGDVVKTYSGPVVTTFEFKPAANVKLSKISNLADDLAMALKATNIRIIAPIPGKDVVGIEIPNKISQTIQIASMLSDELFLKSKSLLTLALGKDIVGNTFVTDLKRLPHLLIAGTTGSGKSVGINAMILSLLYKNSPKTLRFVMIDPKMLEFSMYNDIPHLLTPVITNPEKATLALKNMVAEMERRYSLMAACNTKNIESFNEKAAKNNLEPFAYIVIIIDELADLMMTAGKEVEVYIARLAQMARACGMHLIVATQRPSVDVITGLIKANLPSRLSYKVSTQTDSKVILDTKGAESLLGRGDSLFTPPGTSTIVRLHAPFASEEEIIRVVEYLKSTETPNYDESILCDAGAVAGINQASGELDELTRQAIEIMKEEGKTSISYIQRRLSIGYNKAANIIEICEKNGILSPPNSKGARTLL